MADPWAFVAHKDGCWLGVAAAELPDIGRSLAQWIKRGCTITTVHNREEYNALMSGLEMWPVEKRKKIATAPLLEIPSGSAEDR